MIVDVWGQPHHYSPEIARTKQPLPQIDYMIGSG